MDVTIYSTGMPFNGKTVYERSLGGSETAAYYLARALAKQGHRVTCFTAEREDSECDGVKYLYHGELTQEEPLGHRFEHYTRNTPQDVLVIQRATYAFHRPFAAKICIWQLHDLALYRQAAQMLGGTWQIDAATCVSEWHRDQVMKVWNINPNSLFTIPNGVDPDLYRQSDFAVAGEMTYERVVRTSDHERPGRIKMGEAEIIQLPLDKEVYLFQSRPERGLEHLVRPGGIMDRLRDRACELVVVGYDNTVDQMRAYYEQLYAWGRMLPNVTFLGALTKPQLAALQRKCDLMLYPTEFEEVSCISAMEAMHAGLPLLTSHHGALVETCNRSGTALLALKDGKADEDAFVRWLDHKPVGDEGRTRMLNRMRADQLKAAQNVTWDKAAEKFTDMVDELFTRRQASDGAILRDAIEHSDIGFAKFYAERVHEDDTIVRSAKDELDRMYAFTASPEAYAAHYAKHQTAYYDEFEDKVIGEDVTQSGRYRAVFDHIASHIRKANPKSLRILDYGCAHGHYAIPLAKTLRAADIVGVDISERAIKAATRWAERDKVENVEFLVGAQDLLSYREQQVEDIEVTQNGAVRISKLEVWPEEDLLGTYDIILLGEVLEHVMDYRELLQLAQARLNKGGCLIVTTPNGRWEHSGTEAFRTGREHLHHFDRQDIVEICGQMEHHILHAPAGADRSSFPLGSYCWAVYAGPVDFGNELAANADEIINDLPFFGRVDYERKLKTYAARETISACLIVKDGTGTLSRCVESFVDWVDEVIIMVDPATKDGTLALAHTIADRFPNRPFTIELASKSALKDGFDAARNESIEQASGQWILWLDADEEIRKPWMLHMLARPSMHGGYGFAQVHYSADPEQVLTTDFPCRFFRNNMGIKFYGLVHEHPEKELGKAVPWSLVRPEVKFLHHGYFDEETRRRRYQRNLPLLLRDIERYPTQRPLNKFLYLRDIAQSIQFEMQQGGGMTPQHARAAEEGIKLMEKLTTFDGQLRMVADALQYYSFCVAVLNRGFDAKVSLNLRSNVAPDLAATQELTGRFHSRDFFNRLLTKFIQETTKYYEDAHL